MGNIWSKFLDLTKKNLKAFFCSYITGNSIRIHSNGPPGFPLITSQMVKNYDLPLEELLDDSGDDLDSETEILIWIKDFLHNELGKSGVNVPMLLMNNVRSLGSDELVLQVS